MSEPESNKPRQTVTEWILVVWSILLAVIAAFLFAAGWFAVAFALMGLVTIAFALQVTREIESRKPSWKIKEWILPVWSIVFAAIALLTFLTLDLGYVAFPLIGLAIAVSALRVTEDSGTLGARVAAVLGIVLNSVLVLAFLIVFVCMFLPHDHRLTHRLLCATNLRGLGRAMAAYAGDYGGNYPTADKWCDLLIQDGYALDKRFACRGSDAKIGESSYALNKNIAGKKKIEIPPEVALLFETNFGRDTLGRQGRLKDREYWKFRLKRSSYQPSHRLLERKIYTFRWNQIGGREILTTENHEGKGCMVLFNDGSVKFVKTKDLGKLKWKVEDGEELR